MVTGLLVETEAEVIGMELLVPLTVELVEAAVDDEDEEVIRLVVDTKILLEEYPGQVDGSGLPEAQPEPDGVRVAQQPDVKMGDATVSKPELPQLAVVMNEAMATLDCRVPDTVIVPTPKLDGTRRQLPPEFM